MHKGLFFVKIRVRDIQIILAFPMLRKGQRPKGGKSMNKYEMTVVISTKLEEEGRTAELDKVKALIEKFGGTIANIDDAGKKKLAYEIQKMSEGYYYFITFDTDNVNAPSEIESQLRIMENIIRFMCVSVEA